MTKKFDYNFSVKNFDKTYTKHANNIKKQTLKYSELDIDTSEIVYLVESTNFYYYYFLQNKEAINKSKVRLLKTLVNNATRNILVSSLKSRELPASHATALYMKYYKAINRAMAAATRQLVQNLATR